ncbi:adenylyltransferase/cytidyltransferase family protein [Candidatus Viridilinea mediisalina]|uniref:ADP-heptose synthase n=1 Tax=Candidatus Viridilinea mediisalina TaxID=2024553 RepID=A0A2A6RFL2_9CHLR|nr:adenylyltransferase/cytidyltransferase family protein [Candidatus Viridilinea mediisalina]PDW01733.1 ADP-heptose synthase [Candidatus Viridilinea mediisalina]
MTLFDLPALCALRATWQSAGERLVFTNGVFDLLHAGHVAYLSEARRLGERLVVGINADSSTQRLKGPLRPIMPEAARASLVGALRVVDGVVIFSETTAEELVATLRPEIYVKGGDYLDANGQPDFTRLTEGRVVAAYGGQVVIMPFAEGHSTSAIIERIAARYG